MDGGKEKKESGKTTSRTRNCCACGLQVGTRFSMHVTELRAAQQLG